MVSNEFVTDQIYYISVTFAGSRFQGI